MHISSSSVILTLSTFLVCYGHLANAQTDCNSQTTCSSCIRAQNCVWCDITVDETTTVPPTRCVRRQDAKLNSWCKGGKKEDPISKTNIRKDKPLSSGKGRPQVQIQPQRVQIKLRQGEESRFTVKYRQANGYPVDLYFLVDLSNSMIKFRDKLSKLGFSIADAMMKLTPNFQLGFGSFIDKNIAPMMVEPKTSYAQPYSFKNRMPLTTDYELFKGKVGTARTLGNHDIPEGGLDAMMQAIVCTKKIGWRSDARHLLVHVSDAPPHTAGDGRLAGLPEPNDEQCHLDGSGSYTHGVLQDYPSLGQIKWQADQNNINIIFAVFNNQEKIYRAISSAIPGSQVGVVQDNSDNIVKLIMDQYEKLVKTLKMKSNSRSNFLDVKFYSRCLDRNGPLQPKDKCDGIHANDTIEFEVVVKAIDCPEREEDWHQTIEIKPEGIAESVIVDVQLLCSCQCSKKVNKSPAGPRAPECNGHGVLDCGVCSCDSEYIGKHCQCKTTEVNKDPLQSTCRRDNSSDSCSGRGRCLCGSCICKKRDDPEEKYYGTYCECDNFSCRSSIDRKLCGGHGRCDCGECKCDSGWTGSACECKDDEAQCFPPGEGAQKCSNAGKCECGKCNCYREMGREGRFCEDCPSCPSQRCDELKDCVECRIHKTGIVYEKDNNCATCPLITITPVDKVEDDPKKIETGRHVCRTIPAGDGSTFVFVYWYPKEGTDLQIAAKKNKDYPAIDNILAVSIGVVLLTLLIGALILGIWKIWTHIHDKREFEKFENERAKAKWGQGENPIYRQAVTTTTNPTFNSAIGNDDL